MKLIKLIKRVTTSIAIIATTLLLGSASSYALPVTEIAAEDLLHQSSELKKSLNLTPNQLALWQQVEAKIRPLLRTRQIRREKIQAEIKLALDETKTELRDWAKRLDAEEELSLQESRQLRELCLTLNDALDDNQRQLVLSLLAEQVQRPAFSAAKPESSAGKPKEGKQEHGMSHRKSGGMNGGALN